MTSQIFVPFPISKQCQDRLRKQKARLSEKFRENEKKNNGIQLNILKSRKEKGIQQKPINM
jgi:hypothetical protein